jgi:hypothetical protein
MQLGELIADFDDEALAAETITALNDQPLTARIRDAAARQDLTIGEYASDSVWGFIASSGNDTLASTIRKMNVSDQPELVLLHDALEWTLSHGGGPGRPIGRPQ